MGWLSKTFKKITKPVIGAVAGFVGSGFNPIGAVMGAYGGFQMQQSEDSAKKAAAQAEASARRQEIMANAAPTTVQAPGATTLKADVTREDVAGERRRRMSINKTTGLGISRMANNYGKKQTVG